MKVYSVIGCQTEEEKTIQGRLAYPNRLYDLMKLFNRTVSDLSVIVGHMLTHITNNFGQLIDNFNHPWLNQHCLGNFAAAIQRKGAPLPNCIGFIDGTVRAICRPGKYQRHLYNGHKRQHALKYQSIVTPNGLIASMFGPIEGRRHDSFMLAESGLLPVLEAMRTPSGSPFEVYGDPAYPLRPQLISPFRGGILTPEMQEFNKAMSACRVSVEWEFGKILQLFAFVDF